MLLQADEYQRLPPEREGEAGSKEWSLDTLIQTSLFPGRRGKTFLLLKPLRLLNFVTAAVASSDYLWNAFNWEWGQNITPLHAALWRTPSTFRMHLMVITSYTPNCINDYFFQSIEGRTKWNIGSGISIFIACKCLYARYYRELEAQNF